MTIQIEKLIIWPKKENVEARIIPFNTGCVNVITGKSGSGKSAILSIIDYCLASSKCHIPLGPIRDYTSWFGVILLIDKVRYRISRGSPDEKKESRAFEWKLVVSNTDQEIRSLPVKNMDGTNVKLELDKLSQLSDVPISENAYTKTQIARASFRDSISYNFQPQHMVANPNVMFYKADTAEYKKRCKETFGVLLGIETENILLLKHEKANIEVEVKRLRYEIDMQKTAYQSWQDESNVLIQQARELNLISPTIETPAELEKQITLLASIPEAANDVVEREMKGNTEAALEGLKKLRDDENRHANRLFSLRNKLDKLSRLKGITNDYEIDLAGYRGKVKGLEWFEEAIQGSSHCPLCKSSHSSSVHTLQAVKKSFDSLKEKITSVSETSLFVGKEITGLQKEITATEGHLSRVREDIAKVTSKEVRQATADIYKFAGKVQNILSNIKRSFANSAQQERLDALQKRLKEINKALKAHASKFNYEDALQRINKNIQVYASFMELEGAERAIHIDMNDELNLSFLNDEEQKEPDMLWEIGSGRNWMGYHLCTYLGLHKFLYESKNKHISSFVVIDQPSQVYFPSDTYETRSDNKAPDSQDIIGTRKIFELFDKFIKDVNGTRQLIVLEHADKKIYGPTESVNLASIHEVEDWHGDIYLIPSDWK